MASVWPEHDCAKDAIATKDLGDPGNDSIHIRLDTPAAALEPKTVSGDRRSSASSSRGIAGMSDGHDPRYTQLNPEFTNKLTWSNHPRDLDLYGAFKNEKPNLSSDFNVPGLRPIFVEKFKQERWIFQDKKGGYYMWYMWEGFLTRITEEYTVVPELKSVEDVMHNILCNLYWVEYDAIRVYKY